MKLRIFLGTYNVYCRFLKYYAKILQPLNEILKNKSDGTGVVLRRDKTIPFTS